LQFSSLCWHLFMIPGDDVQDGVHLVTPAEGCCPCFALPAPLQQNCTSYQSKTKQDKALQSKARSGEQSRPDPLSGCECGKQWKNAMEKNCNMYTKDVL